MAASTLRLFVEFGETSISTWSAGYGANSNDLRDTGKEPKLIWINWPVPIRLYLRAGSWEYFLVV